jgi:hypothetical protein
MHRPWRALVIVLVTACGGRFAADVGDAASGSDAAPASCSAATPTLACSDVNCKSQLIAQCEAFPNQTCGCTINTTYYECSLAAPFECPSGMTCMPLDVAACLGVDAASCSQGTDPQGICWPK